VVCVLLLASSRLHLKQLRKRGEVEALHARATVKTTAELESYLDNLLQQLIVHDLLLDVAPALNLVK